MKSRASETYVEWKINWLEYQKSSPSSRHAAQNHFYGTLLLSNLEQAYPGFASLKVTDVFIELANEYTSNLRFIYGDDWDKAELESINNSLFLDFMQKLKDNNFFSKDEIQKVAPYIAQAYRTSPDSFFKSFKHECFLSEVAHQLKPEKSR